ncbi:MAG: PAS domain S-box protein [Candidatus Bathyarchaeia archaeon]
MRKKDKHNSTKEGLKQELDRLISLFDGIDEIIYVSDPDTHRLLFVNKKTRELFGEQVVGRKCHKIFQNLDFPCPFCSNKYILGPNLGKTYIWEFQNKKNKRWYRCNDKAIPWVTGKHVRYELAVDITDRKQIEEKLKEDERLFRSIVENSHTGILTVDNNFKLTYVNDELSRIVGCPKEKIIGQDFRKFLSKESKSLVQDRYLRRQRGENVPPRYQFKIVRKDGKKRTVEIKSEVIHDSQGEPQTVAQILDVTEQETLEKERKRFEKRLSGLNKYGHSLNTTERLEDIYRLTLDAAHKLLGFEHAAFLVIDKGKIRVAHQRGPQTSILLDLPISGAQKGVIAKAANTGKSVLVTDTKKNKDYIECIPGIRSELAVPVKTNDKLLGVLNIESKKVGAFDFRDMQLLQILASHAATAISNLEKRREIEKRSSQLALLMKSSTEMISSKDLRRRLQTIAEAIKKLGWRRVVISVRDDSLEIARPEDIVTAGLTDKEEEFLWKNRPLGKVWKQRFGPEYERFKIGEFYHLPWSDPWVRKKFSSTTIPSQLSPEEMVDWNPQDLLYAPLRLADGRVVGVLSVDDPLNGKKPNEKSLAPLELFIHQAAVAIENARLIQELKNAQDQLKAEAELLELKVEERTRELKEAQEQLLKAQRLAAIGELAGMVGHDLRNPLTGIAGAAYYLKIKLAKKGDDKIREILETIEKSVEHSNKIINDLSEYSKELQLELAETTPKKIIKEILSTVKIPKNITILNSTKNEPKIKVDIYKMKRAFGNIIKNAIDAMPQGGKLEIKTKEKHGNLEISFTDTGEGIVEDVLTNIWTPLYTTKAKGMGFGLPICKRIVEAHECKIFVKSKMGEGTTFTVTIPLKFKSEGGEKIWLNMPESSLLTTTKA